jgi:hypothetical protein
MQETLSYSEKVKGWPTFHSFIPDYVARLNKRLFTVKDGQLYLHNDQDNPVRNNFYGEQFTSKVTTEINDAPADDKIFKTLVLEGDKPWKATLKTNYTEGVIEKEEFNQRESRWFSHTRRNESQNSLNGDAVQGIGVIVSVLSTAIRFNYIGDNVNVGDDLYQINNNTNERIGNIIFINGNIITLDAIETIPVPGYFSYSKKNSRIEGEEIRGYYLEVTLEQDDLEDAELFAINTNAIKSYV